ncbi:MAG TPA: alpha/beta hydrolase [Thermodesulfobacteriota bacterium]
MLRSASMPRMLATVLLALAIGYAVLLVLVYVFQSRLVYFPDVGRGVATTPAAYGLPFETHEIETEDGERLHAWWVPVRDARGTALVFHGNAGNISHRIGYLQMFHRLGYASLIVDYRGYGQSTGRPSEDGTYRDAEAAWRWLVARGVAPTDVVLVGESLGGAVAAWLAARVTPRALVLLSTFTSVPDLGAEVYPFLPVHLLSRFSYDTLGALRRVEAPVLVAHSRDDEVVPYRHGLALFAAAREPKRFLEMHGGHNEGVLYTREAWVAELGAFLERTVR